MTSLCNVDEFSKIWHVSFLTRLHWKGIQYYSPSQGKWFMSYILIWRLEWRNLFLTFSTYIYHLVVIVIDVCNGTASCLPRFVNFASTFLTANNNFLFFRYIWSFFCEISIYKVVCECFILKSTSTWMLPGLSSGNNNDQTVLTEYSTKIHTFKTIQVNDM